MKKCKYCQSEIDNKTKVCPNCGKKQPLSIVVIIIIVVAVLLVLAAIVGSDSSNGDTRNNDNQAEETESVSEEESSQTGTTEKKENLVLEDGYSGSLDEYGAFYYIEGYVKNNSDKDYEYVQIEFIAYDSEGNTLGSCYDYTSSLEANGRWKFKASCLDETDKIASYKLKEITGY